MDMLGRQREQLEETTGGLRIQLANVRFLLWCHHSMMMKMVMIDDSFHDIKVDDNVCCDFGWGWLCQLQLDENKWIVLRCLLSSTKDMKSVCLLEGWVLMLMVMMVVVMMLVVIFPSLQHLPHHQTKLSTARCQLICMGDSHPQGATVWLSLPLLKLL